MREFVHTARPARVVFGVGALARVPAEVAALGCRRVVLVGGGPQKALVDDLAAALDDRVAGRLADVVEHVPVDVAAEAVAAARRAGADGLVCLGGGSATGLAKAVALDTGLPVLAVPTTYAGSEMTPIWGRTDGTTKTTGRDPRVLPRTVVYDPALTVSLPAGTTAASGLNALAHCVEALYAADASPVTSLVAAEGARALAAALPSCVESGSDVDARGEALYGARLAGSSLGATTMGLHHKLAHVLGGAFRLPHAETHAALLPYVTAYNAPAAPDAMARLAAALGAAPGDAAGAVWDPAHRTGAPTSLASVSLSAADVPAVAEQVAAGPPANPRAVDADGVRALLLAALDGVRPRPVGATS